MSTARLRKWFKCLRENDKTLTELNLIGSIIDDADAKLFAKALKKNNKLQLVFLSHNTIGAKGAKEIAKALKHNSTLQALYLSANNIGDEGAKAIAEALKKNKTLLKLALFQNNIGDDGAKEIAKALKQNNTLQVLYLYGNNIGEEGAKEMLDVLQRHNTSIIACTLTITTILQTSPIEERNKVLVQLRQQAYDLALALWPLFGGDVYTLLLMLKTFPRVFLVPQYMIVRLLQQAVDYLEKKEVQSEAKHLAQSKNDARCCENRPAKQK